MSNVIPIKGKYDKFQIDITTDMPMSELEQLGLASFIYENMLDPPFEHTKEDAESVQTFIVTFNGKEVLKISDATN